MLRTVVIDRAAFRRVVRQHRRGWWWNHGVAVVLLALVAGQFGAAAVVRPVDDAAGPGMAVFVVLLLLVAGAQQWRSTRAISRGMSPGTSFAFGYAGADFAVLDEPLGRIWLPFGSAMRVVESDASSTVFGRDITFSLPPGLLAPEDNAFLEGRAGAVATADDAPAPPPMPRRVTVDDDVLARLLRARSGQVLRSRAAVFWYAAAVFFVGMTVVAAAQRGPWELLFLPVAAGFAALSLVHVRIARRMVRLMWPIGSEIVAGLDAETLTMRGTHVVIRTPWSAYLSARVSAGVLVLRRGDSFGGGYARLPLAMLTDEDLGLVARSLGSKIR